MAYQLLEIEFGERLLMVLDARGVPTHACPECGEMVFIIRAMFVDYEIAMWFTEGKCSSCGTLVTVPTPVDRYQ